MARIQCDICGGNLIMDSGAEFSRCEKCGLQYKVETLRGMAGGQPAPDESPSPPISFPPAFQAPSPAAVPPLIPNATINAMPPLVVPGVQGVAFPPSPPVRPKKPLYRKWWFWLIVVVVILSVAGIVLSVILNAVGKAERESIIDNYIYTQQTNYGWPDNSISVDDQGDLVVFKFFSGASSHELNGWGLDSAQVEADMLASSLKSNVLICGYSSDYYLECINIGAYVNSSQRTNEKTINQATEITTAADAFAVSNREKWLNVFCKNMGSSEVWAGATYRIQEDKIMIAIINAPGYSTDYEGNQGFLDAWQEYASAITIYVRADIMIGFLDDENPETENLITAEMRDYLYIPETLQNNSAGVST